MNKKWGKRNLLWIIEYTTWHQKEQNSVKPSCKNWKCMHMCWVCVLCVYTVLWFDHGHTNHIIIRLLPLDFMQCLIAKNFHIKIIIEDIKITKTSSSNGFIVKPVEDTIYRASKLFFNNRYCSLWWKRWNLILLMNSN